MLVVALLSAFWVVSQRATSPALLADSDTVLILEGIEAGESPWQWFLGDWPLANGFYRPVSTLPFQLDLALHSDNAAGFGLTNALLCALCILLLAWLVREWTDAPWVTGAATVVFAMAHLDSLWLWRLSTWVLGFGVVAAIVCLVRTRRMGIALGVIGVAVILAVELTPLHSLYYRMVGWIPGRTASTMTIFCLLAMAAYARYLRLTPSPKTEQDPATPFDLPEYKRPPQPVTSARHRWSWAVLAVLGVALALGAYEQAVMLPAVLIGLNVYFAIKRGLKFSWAVHLASWGLLFGYLALRVVLLDPDPTRYQRQAFRQGPGTYFSLMEYLLPGAVAFGQALIAAAGIWLVLILTSQFAASLFRMVGFVLGGLRMLQHPQRWLFASAYALSFLAFLPMAWLHHFDHYHYWPIAIRSVLVAGLLAYGLPIVISGVLPPARQAPPRPNPAPGSLPHR